MVSSMTIDEIIAEVTHVGGARRVCLGADIGNSGVDEVEWEFLKGGRMKVVTVPRAVFTYEREPPMKNFWLVEMPERFAAIYGIDDMVLSDEEATEVRKRFLNANNAN